MSSPFILDIAINVHFLNSFLESNVWFFALMFFLVFTKDCFFFNFFFFRLDLAVFLPIVLWECEKLGLEKLKKLLFLMQINTHWFYCIDKLLVGSLKACGLSRTELLTHSIVIKLINYNPVIISLHYHLINTL